MPVTLTVRQVRDALYLAEQRPDAAPGTATTAELGQWFHEGVSFLVSDQTGTSPLESLRDIEKDLEIWKATLREQVYSQFVGPRLTRHCAALQGTAAEVRQFWMAMKSVSDWIASLCWSLNADSPRKRTRISAPWQTMTELFQTDQPLVCELRDPGWSDSVRLVGIADALIKLSESGEWCVLEFKSGKGSPAADLGQVCLYHMILTELEKSPNQHAQEHVVECSGALALLSFCPELHERLYHAHELTEVRKKLLDLIAQLAGVQGPVIDRDSQSIIPETAANIQTSTKMKHVGDGFQESEEHLELGKKIVRAFAEHGREITLEHPVIAGPTFLRYHVIPGKGTRISALKRLSEELQVQLQLKAAPFIFVDEGRLVIDVQRPDRQTVLFNEIRDQLPPADPLLGSSCVPVGVNLAGELECVDLSKSDHAHILVAGTTGSGKSEWLRTAIAGMIVRNTPATLRLVIIDPKRNAFYALRNSPYLWEPIVFPDEQPAHEVLERLCVEMEKRYQLLEGADTVNQLVAKSAISIPRIVCVCDEYRDLISRNKNERKLIEAQICRLGAKARAAGIHLILATQEPSRETIKGPLDSNMPTRIGLRLGRDLESRMLLGESGAEKLLGHGDLLFKVTNTPRRLQAPLLTEADRNEIFGCSHQADMNDSQL